MNRPTALMNAPQPQVAGRRCPGLWAMAIASALLPASLAAQESVATLAGKTGEPRHADGTPAVARLSDPAGLARTATGLIHVADSANHCLRTRLPDGSLSTLTGRPGEPGFRDGSREQARFDSPTALAVTRDGALLVSDTGNHVLRRVLPNGQVSTLAGLAGDPGPTNGPALRARFNAPLGIAVASDGHVFIADSGNHSIRQLSPAGEVTTLAGENGEWGAVNGSGSQARFQGPVGLAVAADGSLVVSDALNHALRRVTRAGQVTTLAGKLGEDGSADGPAAEARFGKPAELAFDALGRLYIVDALLHTLRRLDPDGTVRTVAGLAGQSGGRDGSNGTGRFFNPYGVTVTASGSLLVSDTYNATLREVVAPFALQAHRPADAPTRLEWESVIGHRYQVWFRDQFDAPWQRLGEPRTATGLSSAAEDSTGANRFYQVERLD
jgi:sugar lactone lactonase YvrE